MPPTPEERKQHDIERTEQIFELLMQGPMKLDDLLEEDADDILSYVVHVASRIQVCLEKLKLWFDGLENFTGYVVENQGRLEPTEVRERIVAEMDGLNQRMRVRFPSDHIPGNSGRVQPITLDEVNGINIDALLEMLQNQGPDDPTIQ